MVAACLLGVSIFELLELHGNVAFAGLAAAAFLLAFLIAGQQRLGTRERFLVVLAAASAIAAFVMNDQPWLLVERGMAQATFLAAFMLLLSLLRDGAITSPSVLSLGEYLTRRPPGQRYLAIHTGGHLLGMVLNFGALSLLGPLIQRGVKATAHDNPELADWREQRQLSALARGFSWIIAWSPTAVTQALVISVIASANPLWIAAIGLTCALGIVLIGWLDDRMTGRTARASLASHDALPVPDREPQPFPARAFGRFGIVCLALVAISGTLVATTGSGVVPALMLASPVVTLIWVRLQFPAGNYVARLKAIAWQSIPAGSPEAVTLSAAGFIGIVLAGLTDARWLADTLGLADASPILVYLAAMAIVPLASNLAMPPMLTVTFLGSLFANLPGSTIEPSLLAAAFALGWAINLTASPFGATSLILARITGIAGTTLSWKWNGRFSLLAYGWAAIVLMAAARLVH